jgi:hypothetical protein
MLSKTYRVPREIDDREIIFDPRPKSAQEAAEEMIKDMKEMPTVENYLAKIDDCPIPPIGTYGFEIERSPIDRIAELANELTYGEMITLAAQLLEVSNGGITEQNLPDVLWDWAHKP